MSDVESQCIRSTVYGGAIVDVVEEGLPRIQKILSGVRGGWQKAVGSALARAAASGKTEIKRAIADEYTISQGEFLRATRNINHYQRDSMGGVSVEFGYAGYVIPLMHFATSVSSDGRVTTQVKRAGARETLNNAFRATMGAHTGIFERIGPSRFPVRELFGPSTPQMMYSNEDVLDKTEKKITDEYEKRVEHEILRLMNGWGG